MVRNAVRMTQSEAFTMFVLSNSPNPKIITSKLLLLQLLEGEKSKWLKS